MSIEPSTNKPVPDPDPEVSRTFLFTDVEGSTRLWEIEPERMRVAMARHDALSREAVRAAGGRIVKSTGDGVHAVFDAALDALCAALHLQRALAAPAPGQGLELKLRCGLHCGASEARDGDYYGPALNRAARVMSAAHGGQTLLTQAVADRLAAHFAADFADHVSDHSAAHGSDHFAAHVSDHLADHPVERSRRPLPPGTTLLDLGLVRLRDLTSPEHLYQLQHPDLRASFPPLRSLEATPNNLAQQLNSFVGRERELAEVRALLAKTRLLTLLGMGGIGKSRLSVQLGAELLDEYPDGVWLVELAPLSDPGRVAQALATVLGLREDSGRDFMDVLLAYARDKTLLVILDNCEHVVHACAALAKQLLQTAPGARVLATSRDVLQVAGEAIFQVPTLSVPGAGGEVDAARLTRHDAVRLFVDRAVAAQPTFRLDEHNAAAVADICRRLDGIPLALELAAARTRALSVQAIAARLSDRFRLLATGDRTVLPRQRTLRALIDWSFELLDEPERQLFARLAVFAGGWTLEAAQAVCSGAGLDRADVLDLLAHLVDKSLVVIDAGGSRYRMLETVRAYASEKLAASAEQASMSSRHAEHYLGQAEVARSHLAGPQQGSWLAALDADRDNLMAAGDWLGRPDGDDGAALRLVFALRTWWINRGELSLGLHLALEVLERPGLGRRDASRCMALFNVGQLCFFMGRNEEARRRLGECLAIAREIDAPAIVARTLQPLGMTDLALGDFESAARHLHEAVHLAEQVGDERDNATALNALAMLHRLRGAYDEARPICERVLALLDRVGDQENIGLGLVGLAMVAVQQNDLARAGDKLEHAASIARETGSLPVLVGAVEASCGLAAAQGRWDDAAQLHGAAQAQRARANLRRDPADDAFVTAAIGRAVQALGRARFEAQLASGSALGRQELLDRLGPPVAGR